MARKIHSKKNDSLAPLGCVHRRDQMNLFLAVGVNHGYIGDALTQLKVEGHVHPTFMSRIQ